MPAPGAPRDRVAAWSSIGLAVVGVVLGLVGNPLWLVVASLWVLVAFVFFGRAARTAKLGR